ncbi:Telomerase protein component 1 [Dissostichus eleginoides]|uniref:Telomerase protein component 1 n=1 Tax=Dissostichus eleginoides TaxID=100907 RepID=A0AAD9BHI9_DISEL|nr:Telomerase protein component 1 [Dissostichus eleginoides]
MRRAASQLAASTISLAETGPGTSAAVMENSPVGMAGLREGSWIVLGVWQRGAQSENSRTGTTRIAEHDGELVLLMAGRQRLGAKQQPNIIG